MFRVDWYLWNFSMFKLLRDAWAAMFRNMPPAANEEFNEEKP
jgi:hypothetical protein